MIGNLVVQVEAKNVNGILSNLFEKVLFMSYCFFYYFIDQKLDKVVFVDFVAVHIENVNQCLHSMCTPIDDLLFTKRKHFTHLTHLCTHKYMASLIK